MFKEIINKSKIALETNEGKINGELLVNQSVESTGLSSNKDLFIVGFVFIRFED